MGIRTPEGPKGPRVHVRLTDDEWQELHQEALRLDRPISWVVKKAWRLAKQQIAALPGIEPAG